MGSRSCTSKQLAKVLKKIYFDPKNPGSFGGVVPLHRQARKETDCRLSELFVKKWLSNIPAYSLHKPAAKKFPRLHYVADGPYDQFQADLLDFGALVKYNDGYRYLLVVIDIFTRRAWVEPLKSKSANEVLKAIEAVFGRCERLPHKFQTDRGTEFVNAKLQKLLEAKGITWLATQNQEIKCAQAERLNQTIGRRLHRYFTYKQTRRWTDVIQDMISSYNASPHRSLKFHAPNDVTDANFVEYQNLPKLEYLARRLPRINVKVGDYVRISLKKGQMEKGALQQWSDEVYKVYEKLHVQDRVLYKLKDLLGEEMVGRFYPYELRVVPEQTNESAPIGIIKQKGNKVLVHYIGWDKKFDVWMNKKDIQQK